jgi:archaemetzincin
MILPTVLIGLSLLSASPDHISILPLGTAEHGLMELLGRELATRFMVPVKILPAGKVPDYAYDPERGQYVSSAILDSMIGSPVAPAGAPGDRSQRSKRVNTAAGRVLAVVDVDLYADDLNFVFGQADIVDRAAVISLTRLREEFYGRPANAAKSESRMIREAVHELGHTYGLTHCQDPTCVMFFSNRLADTDRKSSYFCSECRAKLARLMKRR